MENQKDSCEDWYTRFNTTAPELLKSCIELLAIVENKPEACGYSEQIIERAHLAISKAKGEK